jgi:type VI secretion system protein ImpA
VAELCDRYWEGLYPLLGDEGDASARVALVEWMDEVFSERLRITPFADAGEGASFTLLDWERAGQTSAASSESEDGDGAPRPTRESLLAKISLGGGTPWSALVEDVSAAIASAHRLEEVSAARLERPPTMRRVRDVLSVIDNLARDGARISGEVLPGHAVGGAEDVAAFEASGGSAGREGGGPRLGGAGPITSRADAYYRLAEAAEYLLRTEPHSPVPYLVKRAVGWGNMSLAELLYEFVGNADDLVAIQRLLGMRGKEE